MTGEWGGTLAIVLYVAVYIIINVFPPKKNGAFDFEHRQAVLQYDG